MSLPYMPFYVSDYMADAGHLPTIGHGAYMLLLINYWQRQGPIPADDFTLQGITKLSDTEWEKLRSHLAAFFQEVNGKWHHKRVDAEIERASAKIELARNKGKASAQNRLNRSSTPVEPQLNQVSTIEAKDKGKDNTALLSSNEDSCGSRAPPPQNLAFNESECLRRCQQALGSEITTGFGAVMDQLRAGVSIEDRILPIVRQIAREGPEIRNWSYVAKAAADPLRMVDAGTKEIETVFVVEGGPEWMALCRVKRESYLRTMLKPAGNGTSGLYWPKRDIPTISSNQTAGAAA